MPDEFPLPGREGDDLMFRAMLYVSGELEPALAAAFEQRLGGDQAARDALCQAVELTQNLAGQESAGPDPAYRSRVRRRLRQRRRQRLSATEAPGMFIGQPAFWSILGAAVAVVLMVVSSHVLGIFFVEPKPTTAPEVKVNLLEMAVIWADLHNNDRLEKVHAEQRERQQRAGKGRAAQPEPNAEAPP